MAPFFKKRLFPPDASSNPNTGVGLLFQRSHESNELVEEPRRLAVGIRGA